MIYIYISIYNREKIGNVREGHGIVQAWCWPGVIARKKPGSQLANSGHPGHRWRRVDNVPNGPH